MKKNKYKILFRTAGGKAKCIQLGMGHIYRSLNLAEALNQFEIHFLTEDYGGAINIISKHKIKFNKEIPMNISLEEDIKKTLSYINKNEIQILIIDKYNIQKKYLQKLKKYVKVIVITDLLKKDYPADLLINGFIGFKNTITKNKYNTKCLLGPKFQILDKKFESSKRIKKRFDILVTFGGYDEKNIAKLFLDLLHSYKLPFKVKIIIGPVGSKVKNKMKNIKVIQSSTNMSKEIRMSKFGFCTGGITTYEFAKEKVPFAIICDDRHQLLTAKNWEQKGIAYNLGLINKNTSKKIQEILEKIEQNKLNLKSKSFVDGKGVSRVAREIVKILEIN